MPSVWDFQEFELIYAGDKFVTLKKKKGSIEVGQQQQQRQQQRVLIGCTEETVTVLLCRRLAGEKKPAAFHENTQTSDRTHKLAIMLGKYIFLTFSLNKNAYFCRFPFNPLM